MEPATEGDGWRCLWASGCELAEGPIWDPARKLLWFVDIEKSLVHRLDPVSLATASWAAPCRVGSIGLRDGPGPDRRDRTRLRDPRPARRHRRMDWPSEADVATNRFNDGKVDAAGRFWAGTMDETKAAAIGTLYRLDRDRTWAAATTGYIITNGPAFSLDGRTLYENDTLGRATFAYDIGRRRQPVGQARVRRLARLAGQPRRRDHRRRRASVDRLLGGLVRPPRRSRRAGSSPRSRCPPPT